MLHLVNSGALYYSNIIKISTYSSTLDDANCAGVWNGAAVTVAGLYGVSRGQ